MAVVVGVLAETQLAETRVAVVPEIAAKLKAAGGRVLIERGAEVNPAADNPQRVSPTHARESLPSLQPAGCRRYIIHPTCPVQLASDVLANG